MRSSRHHTTRPFGQRARRGVLLSAMLTAASLLIAPSGALAGPTPVDLGTAEPFAILSGTGVTDSPTSVISGDVGVDPTGGASITGLLCGQVTGTIYDNDGGGDPCFTTDAGLLLGAKNALTAAYIDVGSRTPVTIVPTELGNTTLIPGVYAAASTTFGLSNIGPLVLDAQGDLNGVFIFQMAAAGTGLTVGPGGAVSLINGAQACNVWWWVDTATINTGATFVGTILALTSITVADDSDVQGRLLARNGNVTLINDTITRPTTCVVAAVAPTTPTAGTPSTSGTPSSAGTAPIVPITATPRTTG